MLNGITVGPRPGLDEAIAKVENPAINENLFFGTDIRECDIFADAPIDYLVESVMVRDQITLLAGASKSLKTTILCDLVVALLTGTDWLEQYPVVKECRALFITGENGIKSASRKIRQASKTPRIRKPV